MLHWMREFRSTIGRWFHRRPLPPPLYPHATTGSYYQSVHNTNDGYKRNNWLLSELDYIFSLSPRSILELGCGNGRFIAAVKERGIDSILGVDWAKSPILEQLGISSNFQQLDITQDQLPKADLVCSADVLEHIHPKLLSSTLQRLHAAGREQYHVIACYDDGHSHLSIMQPKQWLRAFRTLSPRYRIFDIRLRRNNPSQPICIIATFDPHATSFLSPDLSAAPGPPSREAR